MSTIFTSSSISKALFILGDLNADYRAFKKLVEDAEFSKEPEISELHLILTGNSGIVFPQQLEKISVLLPKKIFFHYAGGNSIYDNWEQFSAPAGTCVEIAKKVFRHGSGSMLSIGGSLIMLIGRCESLKGDRTEQYNAKNEILTNKEFEEIQKNLMENPPIIISPLPPLKVLKECTKTLFENDVRKRYLKSKNAEILDNLIFKKPPLLWIHSCPQRLPSFFDNDGIQHVFLNGISYSANSIAYLYNGQVFYNK